MALSIACEAAKPPGNRSTAYRLLRCHGGPHNLIFAGRPAVPPQPARDKGKLTGPKRCGPATCGPFGPGRSWGGVPARILRCRTSWMLEGRLDLLRVRVGTDTWPNEPIVAMRGGGVQEGDARP